MEQIQEQLRTPNSQYVQRLLSKVSKMNHEFAIDFMEKCKMAWKFLLCTPCELEDVTTDGLHCTIDSTNTFEIAPSVVFSIMKEWEPGMTSLLLHDSKNLCHSGPQRGMTEFYNENKFRLLIVSFDCFFVFTGSHVIITTKKCKEQDDIILAILYHLFRDDIPVYLVSNDKKGIDPANIPDLSGMGDTWQELRDVISAGIGGISMSWNDFIKTYSSSTASPPTSLAGGYASPPPTSLTGCASPSPTFLDGGDCAFSHPTSFAGGGCVSRLPTSLAGCASPSPTSLGGGCASPSPTSCFLCNSEDHRSNDCPLKKKKPQAKSTATTPVLPHDLTKHL
jgi:hypothetical protein